MTKGRWAFAREFPNVSRTAPLIVGCMWVIAIFPGIRIGIRRGVSSGDTRRKGASDIARHALCGVFAGRCARGPMG